MQSRIVKGHNNLFDILDWILTAEDVRFLQACGISTSHSD